MKTTTKTSKSLSTIDLLDFNTTRVKGHKAKRKRRGPDLSRAERFLPTAKDGLTAAQVQKRSEDGLVNVPSRRGGKSYLSIILGNLFTYINILTLVVFVAMALVVDFAKDWSKFLFVIIILCNTIINIVLECKSKRSVEKLKLVTAPSALVVRNGELKAVAVSEVVLDDIIYLESGKQICADSIITEGDCEVNESLLTGESAAVEKKKGDAIFSGSYVVSGNCYARVDKIGDLNYVETLSSYAKKYKKPKSEINHAITLLIKVITIIMIPIAVLMVYFNYTKLSVDPTYLGIEPWARGQGIWYTIITTTSGSIIGMIPSGMFLLTSVALTVSVLRLVKKRTLVKDLYCIEMLARVDTLCLDKTGTITDGSMSVKNIIEIKGAEVNGFKIGDIIGSILSATEDNNQTAIALADKFGYNLKYKPTVVMPFSSQRKLSAVTFEEMGTYMLGAPEFVLSDMGLRIKKLVDDNAAQGYRVLCLAHSPSEIKFNKLPAVRRPLFLIVIEDHIRADAIDTVKWFKENDVAVKVISGDNPITVSEVARRVGVANVDKYISLDGLSNQAVIEAANKYTVFGRVSPEQKSILIRSMKAQGHTVAMTGDGVNDILAMRQSDCAVSVASGAEAARNVAHIVLQDNNFSSMPDVVVEGRRVINNIAKSSSLYLMKTLMTVILSIVALAIGSSYFFTTNMTMMYEILITAIPSFFLALQVNKNRVQGKFLHNVLKSSIPGGITLALSVVAVYLYWVLTLRESGTIAFTPQVLSMFVIALTFAGFLILLKLCQPFNGYRVVLVMFTLALCIFCITVLPKMFGITFVDDVGVAVLTLTDGFFLSTVVLAAYGIDSIVMAIIGKINVSTQEIRQAASHSEVATEKPADEFKKAIELSPEEIMTSEKQLLNSEQAPAPKFKTVIRK